MPASLHLLPQPSDGLGPVAGDDAVAVFLDQMGQAFDSLSPQLKRIASYVEAHHERIGLEKIQDIAGHCGVQPSAVVRFAKHFGFSGYIALQKIFRNGMAAHLSPQRNYQTRIREAMEGSPQNPDAQTLACTYLEGAIAGMQTLHMALQRNADFPNAVDLMAQASCLWVVGTRRAFPVASYLAYALQQTHKPVQMVTGLGGMNQGQLRSIRPDDVLIAISFTPYADETLQAVAQARAQGARVIALTDSRMGPLAKHAAVSLMVTESTVFGFRSLTNTMALAQSLFIALAYRLETDRPPSPADSPDSPPSRAHAP